MDNKLLLLAAGGAAVLTGMYLYGRKPHEGMSASVGSLTVSKNPGSSVTVSVQVNNTGNVASNFAVGCSIMDASGQIWDIWDSTIMKAPGTNIDVVNNLAAGSAISKQWTFSIPSNMAVGPAQLIASVWKATWPVAEPRLGDTGWKSGLLTITAPALIAASVTNLTAA